MTGYLAQSIENAFQEKQKIVEAFIDLSEAFDRVWGTPVETTKMQTFCWIKSFLCNRAA
jgi:hypothetical protein